MAKKKNEDLAVARAVFDIAIGFVTTIEDAGGTIEDARRAIFKDETLRTQLGLLVMGKLKLGLSPCQRLVPHLIPDWVIEVVEDVEPTVTERAALSFPDFLQEGETCINGETMRGRAKEMKANKGLSDVPALLGKDGKGLETISAELRGKSYIVLTGTVLQHSDGCLYVPCLIWGDGRWVLVFWGGYDWDGHGRLVSCE